MRLTLQRKDYMIKTQREIPGEDGHLIVAILYTPKTNVIGHIHILHGMAEHQQRYEKFAMYLTEQGYAVSTHDHRGHGLTAKQNDAPFGYFAKENGFEVIVDDAHRVIEAIRQDVDWDKVTIIGHSMGSFVARRYIQEYSEETKKVILIGTGGLNASHRAGLLAARFLAKQKGPLAPAKLLEQVSFGSYNNRIEPVNTPSDWLSTDPDEVQKYLEDEWCGFTCTNQLYVDLLSGMTMISKEAEINKIRKGLPILLISGREDPVGEYGKGVWRVAKQYYHAGFTHVAVHLFEHKRHEILNEQNNEMVYKTIIKWLEKKGHDRIQAV